jgi:DNA-binding transcriptional ArsR family regulator
MAYADSLIALADPTRRSIFDRLVERPSAVGELAEDLPVTRPAVSQHLKVLKEARLVSATQVGNRRIYRPDPAGIVALQDQLDHYWTRALEAYKEVVEADNEEES